MKKVLTLVFLFTLFGTSFAGIGKVTVSKAMKQIAKTGSFDRLPLAYERNSEPDAWIDNESTLHVTSGLRERLDTEDEIAGVLGVVIAEEVFKKNEKDAGNYSVTLLRKARYNPRALFDALKKLQGKSLNSHLVTPERLSEIAEDAEISSGIKGDSTMGMEDIADILLGR